MTFTDEDKMNCALRELRMRSEIDHVPATRLRVCHRDDLLAYNL